MLFSHINKGAMKVASLCCNCTRDIKREDFLSTMSLWLMTCLSYHKAGNIQLPGDIWASCRVALILAHNWSSGLFQLCDGKQTVGKMSLSILIVCLTASILWIWLEHCWSALLQWTLEGDHADTLDWDINYGYEYPPIHLDRCLALLTAKSVQRLPKSVIISAVSILILSCFG